MAKLKKLEKSRYRRIHCNMEIKFVGVKLVSLGDMSLEELWELFPITFTDNSGDFQDIYLEEERNLKFLLGNYITRVSHIGSTSISNIKTKPIIDILIEISFEDKDIVKDVLLNNDYILMSESGNKISFNKGYTINGYADKVFHIHIKRYGDCDELYFRDYLNENQRKAIEYEKLKLELFHEYKLNRDLYTDGKRAFVNEVVDLAREKYQDRY